MLFGKLLLSPRPHARVVSIDASAALAMPGVHAILTRGRSAATPGASRRWRWSPRRDAVAKAAAALKAAAPAPGAPRRTGRPRIRTHRARRSRAARAATDLAAGPGAWRRAAGRDRRGAARNRGHRQPRRRRRDHRSRASSRSPKSRSTRASRFSRSRPTARSSPPKRSNAIVVDFEPLDFVIDPLDSLRPGGPNGRTEGNVFVGARGEDAQVDRRRDFEQIAPASSRSNAEHAETRCCGDVDAGFKAGGPRRRGSLVSADHVASAARIADGDGVLAERQALSARLDAERRADRAATSRGWVGIPAAQTW